MEELQSMEELQTETSRKALFKKRNKTEKPPKKEKAPRSAKKEKKRKRRLIILIILAAVVLLFVILNAVGQAQVKKMMQTVAFADTMTLAYGDIENSVSATGTVESNDSHVVYSTQSYQVKSVAVEVGDVVQEGDVLCQLDAEALEDQIKKLEITSGISSESAAQQVKAARDSYNATRESIDSGTNSSLLSAESAVETAYINWQNAQRAYQNYYNTSGSNANLISLDAQVRNAKTALDAATKSKNDAETVLNAAKTALQTHNSSLDPAAMATALTQAETAKNNAHDKIDPTKAGNLVTAMDDAYNAYLAAPTDPTKLAAYEAAQQAYELACSDYDSKNTIYETMRLSATDTKGAQLQATVNGAQTAYDAAAAAYTSAKNAYDDADRQQSAAYQSSSNGLTDAAKAVETARISYENAVASYNAMVTTVENQLETSKNALKTAEISARDDATVFELANLQESLEETRIKAPASGTVTAVYASVGQSGAGVLFVIEDVHDLIVETNVKEYDVGTVQVGMPVTIKSDATGSDMFAGVVASIAPTSTKTPQGVTNTAGDVLFATEVKVTDQQTPLRIGMNVRLNYIVERQEHVLYVPYEAVYENAAGETCVMVLEDTGDGGYLVTERPVTLGVESDLNVVVEGIEEGTLIITDAGVYESLLNTPVTLAETSLLAASQASGMAAFMMG